MRRRIFISAFEHELPKHPRKRFGSNYGDVWEIAWSCDALFEWMGEQYAVRVALDATLDDGTPIIVLSPYEPDYRGEDA
jgi:hypothetical protein